MIPALLANLDKETNDFISTLITKGEYKSKLCSLALAKALASKLFIPTVGVEDIRLHFSMTHKAAVLQKILMINEMISIDIDDAIELTKQFYSYRYQQFMGTEIMPHIGAQTAVEDFFGISRTFSKETLDLIKEHNYVLTIYINRFTNLIEKLKS